jgi:hypothetical protein
VEKMRDEIAGLNSQLKQMKSKGDTTSHDVTKLKQDRTDMQDKLVILVFLKCSHV